MAETLQFDTDVVLSSRVRLARNFKDIPFPPMMNDLWSRETLRRTVDALSAGEHATSYRLEELEKMTSVEKQVLVEKHLISPEMAGKESGGVLIKDDNHLSIMVGEEDHLRLQALLPGFQVEEASRLASAVDDTIELQAEYAFDENWGYLTSCPTNTGTGMRASAMLHLPALHLIDQMGAVVGAAARIGLTVRGFYGEGSEAIGNLYQISNQVTLGRSEEDIISGVQTATRQIMQREREARKALLQADQTTLTDRLYRALGVLKYARRLDSKEFMHLWSDVRLGAELNILPLSIEKMDTLMQNVQPAHLVKKVGSDMTAIERDVVRAQYTREALSMDCSEDQSIEK